MCYHEKISRYWFGLWAKSCTIDRKTEYVAGAIFHTFGLFTPSRWEAAFPGLYIITHVLFIFLRSMVMWRGPHKMDATGRLTYRLLNRDTRANTRQRGPFKVMNWPVLFWIRICTSDVSLCLLLGDCVLKMLFFIEKKNAKRGSGGEAKSRLVTTDRRACWPTQVARIWIRSAVHLDNQPVNLMLVPRVPSPRLACSSLWKKANGWDLIFF